MKLPSTGSSARRAKLVVRYAGKDVDDAGMVLFRVASSGNYLYTFGSPPGDSPVSAFLAFVGTTDAKNLLQIKN